MDSLTQIVLGAAVGEAVLGRKVGNRAMLWGAIGGTIPDLDVFANMATDPMSSLSYHRAFTHSLTFGFLAPAILGWVVHRLYGGREGPLRDQPDILTFAGAFLAFFLLLTVGSYLMPIEVLNVPHIAFVITLVITLIGASLYLRERWRKRPSKNGNASIRGWTLLFFGAIVTHPLLDCFTAYGTQLLQPFSELRVAWNTISVADPMYTLPFLFLLILAGRRLKGSKARTKLNRAGLMVSSLYLLFTVVNYFNVSRVLEVSMAEKGIRSERYVLGPTILNNVLWQATVQEGTDQYYFGRYSLLDQERKFQVFHPIDGQHEALANFQDTRELRILNWFSKGFIGYIPLDSGRVQVNDLRFGVFGDDPNDPSQYLFHWVVDTTTTPITIRQNSGPGDDTDMGTMFGDLWDRMKGI